MLSEDATRNGSTPMSTKRVTAAAALFVCSVDSTRWPVSDASSARLAVSLSRTSPTKMTSGSCRNTERKPRANVSPARSWICTWVMPGSWISTGSSSVITFLSRVATWPSTEYNVLVLPDPVGPVMSTRPLRGGGCFDQFLELDRAPCRCRRVTSCARSPGAAGRPSSRRARTATS